MICSSVGATTCPTWFEYGKAVRQAFVKTGRHSGGIVEIVEGLEAGQQVVTSGQNKLSNGARVIIDNTIDPLGEGAPS